VHGIFADKALQSQKTPTIQPCQYSFPTTTFADAIGLATTFTELVLGTLQDVIEIFAINGDHALTRGVASVVGQEGQQDGFYRLLQNKNKVPSELPFLTTSTRDFAFSALEQLFLKSCPNDSVLKAKLKVYAPLSIVTTNIQPQDQNIQFSFDVATLAKSNIGSAGSAPNSYTAYGTNWSPSYDWSSVSLVYINQQNTPVVEKPQNVKVSGSVVTFDAYFPYTMNLMNGLTLAAVTKTAGPFASAGAVANETLFAPGLIIIN
jgi:hypothetical protein